jgi:Flp pilus assembly protein TadG
MAVALPVLVLVLCGALWAVGCVAAQLRCTDVAGAAARAAARGEPAAEIIRRARTAGPAGATVTIEPNGSRVSVQVTAVVRPFGGLATRLAGIRVTGQAAAAVEEVIDSSPAAMGAASVPSGAYDGPPAIGRG